MTSCPRVKLLINKFVYKKCVAFDSVLQGRFVGEGLRAEEWVFSPVQESERWKHFQLIHEFRRTFLDNKKESSR